jgi:beta-glucosidase
MTNAEKNQITYGISNSSIGCSGNSQGVPRLGFPGFCLQDGPSGVRGADLVSAYPNGIHLGASWNESLLYDVGMYLGAEFKAKGGNLLKPVHAILGSNSVQRMLLLGLS